jgi:predicted ATPase
VTMLNLNRLPPRQCAQMITHVTGGKALPNKIGDQIVDRTDGVPLFIEQLTQFVAGLENQWVKWCWGSLVKVAK